MRKKCSRGPLLVMKPNLLTQEAVPKAMQADGKYNAVAEKVSCHNKGNQCNSTRRSFCKGPLTQSGHRKWQRNVQIVGSARGKVAKRPLI